MDPIEGLKKERETLVRRLKNIDGAISLLTDSPVFGDNKAPKRRVSAIARRKMSQAAKARWAAKKKS